jgi:ABC-2 type transport system permease protein
MWLMMLYHMVALHGLWFAPAYSWMLLASAWARRAVFLWAVLPPVAVGVVEKIAFNTTYFSHWMQYRFGGAPGADAYPGSNHAMHAWAQLNIGQFLLSPSLWSGLIVAALFLFLAARVRRNRGPM